jgi:hypothetical protein
MTLAEGLDMRPLVAHCRSGLAKLYQRTGKRAESDKQRGRARIVAKEDRMKTQRTRYRTMH